MVLSELEKDSSIRLQSGIETHAALVEDKSQPSSDGQPNTSMLRAIQAEGDVLYQKLDRALQLALESVHVS
jgi:hypothetical protein